MANLATLKCPTYKHTEHPMRHTCKSNCDGAVAWEWGTLRCQDCRTKIILFRCDRCGRALDRDDVS